MPLEGLLRESIVPENLETQKTEYMHLPRCYTQTFSSEVGHSSGSRYPRDLLRLRVTSEPRRCQPALS
jgi:hypothetical protein